MNKHAVISSVIVVLTLGAPCRAGEVSRSIGQMECELTQLRQRLTDQDPGIQALKKTIDDRREEIARKLDEAMARRDALLLRFTVKHPDVIALTAVIEDLQAQIRTVACKPLDHDGAARGGQASL